MLRPLCFLVLLSTWAGCSLVFDSSQERASGSFDAAIPDASVLTPPACGVFTEAELYDFRVLGDWATRGTPIASGDGSTLQVTPEPGSTSGIVIDLKRGSGAVEVRLNGIEASENPDLMLVLFGDAQFHRGPTHRGVFQWNPEERTNVSIDGAGSSEILRDSTEPSVVRLQVEASQDGMLAVNFSLLSDDRSQVSHFDPVFLPMDDTDIRLSVYAQAASDSTSGAEGASKRLVQSIRCPLTL